MAGGFSLNKVMIIGNAGRDPEMRYLPSGNPVTTFSVATNRVWMSPEGERHEETEWFRVVAFGKLAETCGELVSKGSKVYVEGRLQTRQWEGQDGQKRTSVEIVANTVIMLDSRPRASAEAEGALDEEEASLDDIPF
jgi:single-strand DNA-binding protein